MKSTKEVGFKFGFYDLEGHDPALEDVETADEAFSDLENEFQDVRAWLIKRSFRHWRKRLDFLLRYMQMLRVRSPLYFDQRKAEGETLRAAVIQEVHRDTNSLTTGEFKPLSAEQVKNWTLGKMREELYKGGDWLWDFQWALRYCDSVNEPFVTTEAPFVAEGPPGDITEQINHPDTLLIFPICWQACLFGSRLRFDKGTDKYEGEALKVFRRKYRSYAKAFLVSPSKLDDITELPQPTMGDASEVAEKTEAAFASAQQQEQGATP